MDLAGVVVLPRTVDALETDLREVEVAIALVTGGAAVRIRLVGMSDIDTIAPTALARAQAAGVEFRIDRGSTATLTIGPTV
jgi:hypothetical protein